MPNTAAAACGCWMRCDGRSRRWLSHEAWRHTHAEIRQTPLPPPPTSLGWGIFAPVSSITVSTPPTMTSVEETLTAAIEQLEREAALKKVRLT